MATAKEKRPGTSNDRGEGGDMAHGLVGWLLAFVLLLNIWIGLWLRRRQVSRLDWSLAMIAGLMMLPRRLVGHGWQGLASAVLAIPGAVVAAVPLMRVVKLRRPPASDREYVSRCRRVAIRLIGATVAVALALMAFMSLFPGLSVPAAYFIGRGFALAFALPLCLYVPAAAWWFYWVRRKRCASGPFRYAWVLWFGPVLAVIGAFVPVALHVRHMAVTGFHPLPGVAAAYAMLCVAASLDVLLVLSSHWLALWGLACGI
jgi:hypothetical protein